MPPNTSRWISDVLFHPVMVEKMPENMANVPTPMPRAIDIWYGWRRFGPFSGAGVAVVLITETTLVA
jgi:hypothetical protein